jgi:4a-hydroxytetrahydrobiopterin dehydratase
MTLLNDAEITEFLDNHSEWSRSGYLISRTFEFPDFVESIGFVAEVAVFAEKANHHPDIDIRWNKVTLRLSTHSEGGLTHKDTDLADLCDALYAP